MRKLLDTRPIDPSRFLLGGTLQIGLLTIQFRYGSIVSACHFGLMDKTQCELALSYLRS